MLLDVKVLFSKARKKLGCLDHSHNSEGTILIKDSIKIILTPQSWINFLKIMPVTYIQFATTGLTINSLVDISIHWAFFDLLKITLCLP